MANPSTHHPHTSGDTTLPTLPSPPLPSPPTHAPSHCRYLRYVARLVAAEKPHSCSIKLRTLRITCVPLVDKERCVHLLP